VVSDILGQGRSPYQKWGVVTCVVDLAGCQKRRGNQQHSNGSSRYRFKSTRSFRGVRPIQTHCSIRRSLPQATRRSPTQAIASFRVLLLRVGLRETPSGFETFRWRLLVRFRVGRLVGRVQVWGRDEVRRDFVHVATGVIDLREHRSRIRMDKFRIHWVEKPGPASMSDLVR